MDVDAQLLASYARTRDAQAFTQLVRRHSGMVFAVANRITRDRHDAEDVAQICFLDLAQQADSIRGSLAGWLHLTATRRAFNANRTISNRRRRERAAARPEAQMQAAWDGVVSLVDTALAELPEELRVPIVLHHLEGRTQAEIAADLGINQGTISRRLVAGVAALREKLKAAGAVAPGMSLPVFLSQHAIEATPRSLVTALGKLAMSGYVPTPGGASSGASSGIISGHGTLARAAGRTMSTNSASVLTLGPTSLTTKWIAIVLISMAIPLGGYVLSRQSSRDQNFNSMGLMGGTTANDPETAVVLNNVFARLKTQDAQGLADGVIILTESRSKDNTPHPGTFRPVGLVLYGQQDSSRLFMKYDPRKIIGKNQLLAGWPKPDLDATLQYASRFRGPEVKITDGQVWTSSEANEREPALFPDDEAIHVHSRVSGKANYYTYPTPADLIAWASQEGWLSRIELLRQAQDPSLVGLYFPPIEYSTTTDKKPAARKSAAWIEFTYWLDPRRNDVPVTIICQMYDVKRKTHISTVVIKYQDYAQLPDGRWYATYWQQYDDWGCVNFQATFYPGRTLDVTP